MPSAPEPTTPSVPETTKPSKLTLESIRESIKSYREKVPKLPNLKLPKLPEVPAWIKTLTEPSDPNKPRKKFPWLAAGGIFVALIAVLATFALTLTVIIKFAWALIWVLVLPFRISYYGLYVLYWPIKLIFLAFYRTKAVVPVVAPNAVVQGYQYSPLLPPTIDCNNTLEFQPWQVLTFVPGKTGDPKPIKYQLNIQTPHALSLVDIDYRDTRLDVYGDGEYIASTSDFTVDKKVFCGADVNACIKHGFSMGTIIVPGGTKTVEVVWSGKDVFPGTDRIVWGEDRKRRVMWKKELCI